MEQLGSYNDYLKDKKLEHSPETVNEYFLAQHALRQRIALERGVDLEDLHRFTSTVSTQEIQDIAS